jgi:hypothetical protein
MRLVRLLAAVFSLLLATGCESLNVPPPRIAFPWQGIADVAGPSPMLPLSAPTTPMRGERGRASVKYPASFAVGIRPNGTISFPQDTTGRLDGANVLAGSAPLVSVNDAGEVHGAGLRRTYAFNEKGELVDPDGHGVRVTPEGKVRALGGSIRYADVMVWLPEARGERWDYSGWRTISILSLVVLENLLPETVGLTTLTSSEVPGPKRNRRAPK